MALSIFILIEVAFGLLCAWVAGQKNRSDRNWFFLGILFGIVSLIALAAVPSLDEKGEVPVGPVDANLSEWTTDTPPWDRREKVVLAVILVVIVGFAMLVATP